MVVGSNDSLYFLKLATGEMLRTVSTQGTVKSAPVVDAWQDKGWLWLASHGKSLQAFNSKGDLYWPLFKVTHIAFVAVK